MSLKCGNCKREKSIDQFHKGKNKNKWYKKCKSEYAKKKREQKKLAKELIRQKKIENGEIKIEPEIPKGYKKCTGQCREIKLLEEYHSDSNYKKDGRRNKCIVCTNKDKKEKRTNIAKTEGTECCRRCGNTKDVSEFYKDADRPNGLRDWCIICVNDHNEHKYDEYYRSNICITCRSEARKELCYERIEEGTKDCNNCGNTKNVSEFGTDKQNSDGLQTYCKTCRIYLTNISTSKFPGFISYVYNNLKKNAKKRKIRVDISEKDIINKYEEQKGLCAYTKIVMTHDRIPKPGQRLCDPKNISVDRIDSKKSYTKDNIQLVCSAINTIKYDSTEERFIDYCLTMSNNLTEKIKEKVFDSTRRTADSKDFEFLLSNLY